MKSLMIVMLALTGLFFGGCALFFSVIFLGDGGAGFDGLWLYPALGFAVAFLCYIGIRNLMNDPD